MIEGEPQRRRLGVALSYWAQYLEVADEVTAVDLGRVGIELQVRPAGLDRDIDLSNVGVGVSQLLPVLLTCLLAQPGSLVLLEQPELHLHPAMQQRLGDFLLACARSGRQLIVETHSEHLISRLRKRAAESDSDEIVSLFKIVFAELDNGATEFKPVATNRFGGIEEWPRGFFDQGVAESREILQLGLRKKQREAGEDT
jgi:predicted ATPase